MPEADVLYSDVKFTRPNTNARGTNPSSEETTYSEVRILKTQPSKELPGTNASSEETTHSEVRILKTQPSKELPAGSQQQGGSKVKLERVALVVLSALLAAAVIALGVTSYKNSQTMEHLQKLTAEHEALKNNLTERCSEVKPCDTVQQTSPQPPAINESCPICEEGWEQHGGKCYYFSTNRSSWNNSRDECRQQGGDLVKIDSREEQTFLELKLRDKMNEREDKFWIGLTDSKEEGTWLWADGSPLNTSLSFWSSIEPDNWTYEDPDGEDCARMGEKSGAHDLKCWFDKSCKKPHRSICEKTAKNGNWRLKCSV
ncbi:hepatic lectin-like isoform X1 [Micropterus salmoides]|uniref:hepatic lectin-like isoform X1 n=1 Tax=Micropterus salmoides TaxID=27706 RepID=UPI0018EB4384|nr:hepatic lectin-like isoform X1 [Micropterus salmoides]